MLATLRIKNLALVSDLTLELQSGYNVITGETGAGKSIILGALNLVLGQRADRALIRAGSDSCAVEAVFDLRDVLTSRPPPLLKRELPEWLAANGLEPCEAGQLILKRTFTNAGTNRQFINGSATTLSNLARVGAWLVDLHGPHDHQSLLQPAKQLAILDAFGGLEHARAEFAALVRQFASLETEKAALVGDEQTYAQQLDLLRFQVQEIEAARLQSDEEETLEAEYHRASNAARLLQLSQTALDGLGEGDGALLAQAESVGRILQELLRVDSGAAPLAELHEQGIVIWRELQTALLRYADRVEVDPARLNELEERLNLINALKRKYGANLGAVLAFGASARARLQTLEARDAELARLEAASSRVEQELVEIGRKLTAGRKKAIPQLTRAVMRQLADLGFKQARFEVQLESALAANSAANPADGKWRTSGLDEIEFQFSPNVGEPLKPLRAIASSGEMARVMLALKTVLAAQDEIPVLIFDEVDANVGGETAHAVGEKMKQIAAQHQVLCITHLPQVAAAAAAHYVVVKQVKAGRTISEITRLDPEARVTELARMLGGQSGAARRHAETLLG
ncbi:MAG TPA: DNA repair protein RecN [Verrucomicrobiota bacterium]|nr:DNA repair protein RecN [Verrucomicrobiota bacterium]HNT15818.1 DNA repair protein RecN [Verrucomicrobiota bacterium]